MALCLTVLAALLENPSSIPSTHVRQLTITCHSSSRASNAFGLHRHLHSHVCVLMHTHTHTHTHTHLIKVKLLEHFEVSALSQTILRSV